MIKYLNPISKFAIDDNTTSQIIIQAFDYYKDKSVNKQIGQSKEYSQVFSCFVRFFNSLNSSRISDDDILHYLKTEGLKGKSESIALTTKYISEIRQIQSTKILFSSPDLINTLNPINNKTYNRGRNIRNLVNFDYKIDVVISSNYHNKLLLPQIYLIFSLDDGEIIKVKVDLRIFNEFRKNLGMHVKKILLNEGISQIK